LAEQFSRRQALLKGGLTLAGLAGATTGGALALGGRRAAGGAAVGASFRLETTDQCSCAACRNHAANKLFATRAAAEHCRAHAGCRCVVARSASIGKDRWLALFGPASELHRTSVDRRWASSRRILKGASDGVTTPAALDQRQA
jgi:hypothetical protein